MEIEHEHIEYWSVASNSFEIIQYTSLYHNKIDKTLQWTRAFVGYDGLKQRTYDAGMKARAQAEEAFKEELTNNNLLTDEKMKEIIDYVENAFTLNLVEHYNLTEWIYKDILGKNKYDNDLTDDWSTENFTINQNYSKTYLDYLRKNIYGSSYPENTVNKKVEELAKEKFKDIIKNKEFFTEEQVKTILTWCEEEKIKLEGTNESD